MKKAGLLALARKALDVSSTESERATSAQMLAKEMVKLLTTPELLSKWLVEEALIEIKTLTKEEQAARDRVEHTVQNAVRQAEAPIEPATPPTWVEFDSGASSPFGGPFGKPPRRPRR